MSKTKLPHPQTLPDGTGLPEGWAHAHLPDVADIIMGQSPPGATYNEDGDGLPFFQGKTEFGERHPTVQKWCSAPNKIAEAGDVLMSIRAPVGPTNVADRTCAIGRGLAAIRPLVGLPTDFLLHSLRFQEDELASKGTGSTFTAINRGHLDAVDLPIPPLPEQNRIVAKVEALLERVNAARARLAGLPAILKRFRQSILSAACSGQLTAEWRQAHPGIEPGRALLARIHSLRIESAETARVKHQIEEAFSEAQYNMSENEIVSGELPKSWFPCRIGAIGTVINGSTPSRKHPEYWDGDIAWVSSGEVRNNILTNTRERITPIGYSNASVKLLPPGTVLIAMIGEGKTRGQSAILKIEATINQNIAAVLLSHGMIVPEFLWRWFQFQYEATRVQGGGSGPQALNCQRVRELPFVLPPLDEQIEIVRRLEALFSLADRIEARVRAATVRAERLPQAILARAFRGELVPTEAELAVKEGRDYEPATVLLERIRLARKEHKPARRGRGGNKMAKRGTGRQSARNRKPLDEVLREQGRPLTPERLFDLAGFDEGFVDGFYDELRKLIEDGKVCENRPNKTDVTLEAVKT
jgi:type I restriction enzyme S subunit